MRYPIMLVLCSLVYGSPALLHAQNPSLPQAPLTATSTAKGFHDSYTRCQKALTAAKALLPLPAANQVAYYGLVGLHHHAHASSCTATVAVTFQFRYSAPSDTPQTDSDPSWIQMDLTQR